MVPGNADYDLDGALLRDEAVYLKKLHSEYLVCDDLKIGNIEPISKEVLNNIESHKTKRLFTELLEHFPLMICQSN